MLPHTDREITSDWIAYFEADGNRSKLSGIDSVPLIDRINYRSTTGDVDNANRSPKSTADKWSIKRSHCFYSYSIPILTATLLIVVCSRLCCLLCGKTELSEHVQLLYYNGCTSAIAHSSYEAMGYPFNDGSKPYPWLCKVQYVTVKWFKCSRIVHIIMD